MRVPPHTTFLVGVCVLAVAHVQSLPESGEDINLQPDGEGYSPADHFMVNKVAPFEHMVVEIKQETKLATNGLENDEKPLWDQAMEKVQKAYKTLMVAKAEVKDYEMKVQILDQHKAKVVPELAEGSVQMEEARVDLVSHKESCMASAPGRKEHVRQIESDLAIVTQLNEKLEEVTDVSYSPKGEDITSPPKTSLVQEAIKGAQQQLITDRAVEHHGAGTSKAEEMVKSFTALLSTKAMTTYDLSKMAVMLLKFKTDLEEMKKDQEKSLLDLQQSCAKIENDLAQTLTRMETKVNDLQTLLKALGKSKHNVQCARLDKEMGGDPGYPTKVQTLALSQALQPQTYDLTTDECGGNHTSRIEQLNQAVQLAQLDYDYHLEAANRKAASAFGLLQDYRMVELILTLILKVVHIFTASYMASHINLEDMTITNN